MEVLMLHNGLKITAFSPSKLVFNIVIRRIGTGLIESHIEWKQNMLSALPAL